MGLAGSTGLSAGGAAAGALWPVAGAATGNGQGSLPQGAPLGVATPCSCTCEEDGGISEEAPYTDYYTDGGDREIQKQVDENQVNIDLHVGYEFEGTGASAGITFVVRTITDAETGEVRAYVRLKDEVDANQASIDKDEGWNRFFEAGASDDTVDEINRGFQSWAEHLDRYYRSTRVGESYDPTQTALASVQLRIVERRLRRQLLDVGLNPEVLRELRQNRLQIEATGVNIGAEWARTVSDTITISLERTDLVVSTIPVVSDGHDAIQGLFGRNIITDEYLSPGEQALAIGAFFVPVVGYGVLKHLGKLPSTIRGNATDAASEAVETAADQSRRNGRSAQCVTERVCFTGRTPVLVVWVDEMAFLSSSSAAVLRGAESEVEASDGGSDRDRLTDAVAIACGIAAAGLLVSVHARDRREAAAMGQPIGRVQGAGQTHEI